MTSRRLNMVLPLVTLVVSFTGVLIFGHVFATAGDVKPPPVSSTPPTPPGQPPSEPPSSPPTFSGAQLELVVPDIGVDDPAPGLLRIDPPVGVSDRRICLTDAVRAAWVLTEGKDWIHLGDALCWAPGDKSSNGELVIVLVKK